MLRQNEDLIRAGGAVVELRAFDKRPIASDWTELPRLTWKEANATFRKNANIGLRLGQPSKIRDRYAYGLDLDVRNEALRDTALAALRALVKDDASFDRVRSGSGGSSRHFYFCSDRVFGTRKLRHSEERFVCADGKTRWAWEIDLGGTGRQFVLPPSIHPVTRKPYVWETDVDWNNLHFVPGDVVQSWLPAWERGRPMREALTDLEEFMEWARKTPNFTRSEVDDILDRLRSSDEGVAEWVDDREGWLRVGFALHNWSDGSDVGYEMWSAFSAESDKFDEKDNRRVWHSMDKGGASRNALTMRTLYDRSNEVLAANRYGLAAPRELSIAAEEDDFNARRARELRVSAQRERDREEGLTIAPASRALSDHEAGVDGTSGCDARRTSSELSSSKGVNGLVPSDRLFATSVLAKEHQDCATATSPDDADEIVESQLPLLDEDDLDERFAKVWRTLRREKEHEERAWEHELERTDADVIKATPHNIALIVAHDWRLRGVIAHNQFTQQTVALKPIPYQTATMFPPESLAVTDPVNGALWTDPHTTNLRLFFATPAKGKVGGYGMKPTIGVLDDAIESAAHKNAFHPIRDFLKAHRWDGVSRMDSVFCRYLGCPDRPYFREVCRLFFLAAVARVMRPGCKWDFAPVLEGAEGLRKSTFIRTLACGWFGELNASFGDRKALVEQMQGVWIAELPELSGLMKSEVADVKAYMSAQEDHVRLSYDRRAGSYPRQSVCFGSTNDPRYLESETGNRRFFPIPCTVDSIDTERLEQEIEFVWAEAYATWAALDKKHGGRVPLFLSEASAADEAFKMQASRKVVSAADVIYEQIAAWLETPDTLANITGNIAEKFDDTAAHYVRTRVSVLDVWHKMLGEQRLIDKSVTANISAALNKLKWDRGGKRRFDGGAQLHYHVRPQTHERDIAFGYVKIEATR